MKKKIPTKTEVSPL